jgi:prepilin-type N-terminal cleavage/methylation domain-containing protein
MRKRVLGFTLIELMIVIAIIAIIAAIAIPGLLRARMAANEGNASASLRSLASAQASFAKACSVDQDTDGQGEFGTLNELTCTANCRGGSKLGIGDMSVAMAATNASGIVPESGLAAKAGYLYHIYLPGDTAVVSDKADSSEAEVLDATAAAIQQQENRWICYAWPATYKSSGLRAFVCDNGAEVFSSANVYEDEAIWDGTTTEPAYDDAMDSATTPTESVWQNIATKDKTPVNDSQTWVPSQ